MAPGASAALPVAEIEPPALAARVGALLAQSLGSPGRLVPEGEGWRWVSLHGRVEVALQPTQGGFLARPHIVRGGLVLAGGLAGLAALATIGGSIASVVVGGVVLKKAIALGVVGLLMSGSILAGPLGGWVTRRRMVRGALRAAGPGVRVQQGRAPSDPEPS